MKIITVGISIFFASSLLAADRVPWTTSRVVGSPDPPKQYHVERAYPKLEFDQPVELMSLGDTGKMMVLEVTGKLYTFDDDPNCAKAKLALEVHPLISDFRRAFGFGVHPSFDENRQVFVVYAGNPTARPNGTRLSRFAVSDDFTIDPASEEILLTWHTGGHNGSAIRFDSKGLLYFSVGDGARPFPPDEYNVSQDLSDLRATICRIDVDNRDGDRPYSIPTDNPFVDTPGARPEIWAYGFRNPWRFTVAPGTDQILCGDVGWELWELIFDVKRGGNYGWSLFEGPQPIRTDIEPGPTPIRKPLVAYPHAIGQSVTGGLIYRGRKHPDLRGAYLYGDYVTGLLWGLRQDGDQATWNPLLAETGLTIITFAESRDHEILIVSFDGAIYRLVKNESADQPSDFPSKLSETGLFASTRTLEPAAGVMAYDVAAKSYADGVDSRFVVGIPGRESIRINRRQRAWKHPKGTVFANTISRRLINGGEPKSLRVETQLLHFNGINWQPYSYLWNDEQTDADLVGSEGITKEFAVSDDHSESVSWHVLNRAQCRSCHSRQNGGAVGFTLENLDRPNADLGADSQVDHFIDIGVIDRRPPSDWNVRPMVDPKDTVADLELRARSYLAANCAHCHCRGGGGTVPLDLSYSVRTDQINALDVAATQGTFGIENARVIDPGNPSRSVLFYRMATSGTGHMPKIWGRENDRSGLLLVRDWILAMDGNTPPTGTLPIDSEAAFGETSRSLQLLSSLLIEQEDGQKDTQRRQSIARMAKAHGNPLTEPLFERFLPPDERRKRLGPNIVPEEILAMPGDAARGRQRFLDGQTGQCVQCHRLQGSGQAVGADLDAIGKRRTRQQLLESILDPSKEVEPKFRSHQVLTADGIIVIGLKILDSEDFVVLRSADGKDHRIAKDDIESTRVQAESLMPTGLAAEMTAQELADLLEFLCSLK